MKKWFRIGAAAASCSVLLTLFACGGKANSAASLPPGAGSSAASYSTLSTAQSEGKERIEWSYDMLKIGSDRVEYEPNRAGQPEQAQVAANAAQDTFVWLRNARLRQYEDSDVKKDAIFVVLELINRTDEQKERYGNSFTIRAFQDGQQLEKALATNNFEFDYAARNYPEVKRGEDLRYGDVYVEPNDSIGFIETFELLNTTSPVTVQVYSYPEYGVEYTFDIAALPPYESLP